MAQDLPRSARVVIVGGGVVGCSIAYHLARAGVSDVVLLERRELTCGTTWHAAGLIGQLRPSKRMTELAKYTAELYTSLEAETGQATGFKQNGSISLATHQGRFDELKRSASMAKVFDLRVDVLRPEEIKERYPLINVEDVVGGIFIPSDGQTNPIDVTRALAKGARDGGVLIREGVPSPPSPTTASASPASRRRTVPSRRKWSCSLPVCGRATSRPPSESMCRSTPASIST